MTAQPRGGRTLVVVVLAVIVVVLVGIVLAPKWWGPLRYGRVEPPVVVTDDLEPAVAKRIERAQAAVAADPYSADAWGELGGVLDVHDLAAEALDCYERAAQLDAHEFRWAYFAGYARQTGDQRAGLDDLARAVELRPDYAPALTLLARSLKLAGDPAAAETHFAQALELDPRLARARIGLAEIALDRGDLPAALAHLERARASGAESGHLHGLLAQTYRGLGREADASRHAELARDRPFAEPIPDPVRNELIRNVGVSMRWRRTFASEYLGAKRPDKAIAVWQEAMRDDPAAGEPVGQIGLIRAGQGRTDEAIDAFRQALELDPMQHLIRNNLGSLLIQRGDVEEGIELLRTSCRFLPDSADAQFNLATGLRSAGQLDAAIEAYGRTVLMDPDHARAHFEHGQLLVQAGRLDEAAAAFRELARIDPDRRAGHANLARTLHEIGRYAEEIAALRAGHAARPDDATLTTLLAWRLATVPDPAARDGEEALRLLAPLVGSGRADPLLLDTLAAAHAEVGNFDAALADAERALTLLEDIQRSGSRPVDASLVEAVASRVAGYRGGRPHRE